ncbi:FAD-binding oxidoreductase [Actinophytocola sp. NPDC049390]|uniref:FAD-binding oxidoreductase n=1 Tax=Actinophytocola sp. NPDC049390 TaxID=3363894 RepID=UPI00378F4CD1
MIVDATTPADVRNAVLVARKQCLPVSVFATGHGGPMPEGEDVAVITTAGMGGVLVDPRRRVARVGAGVRWGEVIAAAAPFGLAPLSGTSPTVGVVGYTLGGGMGWLSRRFGYAADSVLRADIVTADGEFRTVSADREPDLFWAIRGGGANFGVVTALEFRLHPVASVYAGTATFDPARAADVLSVYRDLDVPDELTANIVLTADALSIRGMYAGSAQDARRALAPLFRAAGEPVADGWRTMSYTESGTVGGTAPHNFTLQHDVPVEAVLESVRRGATTVEVRRWGGAIARPAADAGPVGHRDVPFSVVVDGAAEAAAPVVAHATGGEFLNWLHDPSRTRAAYTASDWARLREVKAACDPERVFTPAKSIPPAVRRPALLGA